MSRATATARLLRLCAAAALAPAAPLAAQTWDDIPQDNSFANAANWIERSVPSGSTSVATFFGSDITSINVGTVTLGTLQFTSAAGAYSLNLAGVLTLAGQGVSNSSPARPRFNLSAPSELRLDGAATLGDATVDLFSASNQATLTFLSAQSSAGSATINVGPLGVVSFSGNTARADGSGARFVIQSGGHVNVPTRATAGPLQLGTLEGAGTVSAVNAGLIFGHRGESSTFSGILNSVAPIVKVGAGTFTFSGFAQGAPDFIVQGGAIAIFSDDAFRPDVNSSGEIIRLGKLTLDGGDFRYAAAFDDLRALILGAAGGGLDTQTFDVSHSTGISGAGPLKKLGAGTLTLSAANTHSGGTRVSAGTLAVGHNQALGTGALVLDGGSFSASGGPRTIANSVTLQADAAFTGTQALTVNGAFTLARNRDFTVSASAPLTLAGGIAESGGARVFVRYGSGELILTGASTYTGGTFLAAGITRINNLSGSAFGTGAVTLAAGATLTGAGSFSGAFQNNGTYAPGNSPTLATLSSFAQGDTGVLEMELAGTTRGTGYDALNITGSFAPGGTLTVLLIDGFSPISGESFDLFNWGSLSSVFAALILPDLTPGLSWDSSALYTSGVLAVVGSPIPEPSAFAALAGLGALALAATRRRRSK